MVGYIPIIGASICQYMVRYPGYVRYPLQVGYPSFVQPPGGTNQRIITDIEIVVPKWWAYIPRNNNK